jgi:filamentous hemagglutinin
LKAAVIASQADTSKNTLTTGTLTTSDLQNQAQFNSDSSSMSLSYSGGTSAADGIKAGGGSAMKTLLTNAAANTAGNVLPEEDGTAAGTTRSAISAGTINITGDQSAVGNGQYPAQSAV